MSVESIALTVKTLYGSSRDRRSSGCLGLSNPVLRIKSERRADVTGNWEKLYKKPGYDPFN